MKLLLSLIFILLFNVFGYSQELKDFVVPSTYKKIAEVKGNLDKDSIEEIVYAYNNNQKVKDLGFVRVLYICKQVDGKIKLWKKNSTVLWKSEDAGFCSPFPCTVELTIKIENKTLIIEQSFNGNARVTNTYKDIFRYQANDWYLIGSNYDRYRNGESDYVNDINFSTKKVEISTTYESSDDEKTPPKDEFDSFKYPFPVIPKMDGFIPGKKEIKTPKSVNYFYY